MKVLVAATIGRTVDAFLRPQIAEFERREHVVTVLSDDITPIADMSPPTRVVAAGWTRGMSISHIISALRATRSALKELQPHVVYTHTAIASAIVRLAVLTTRPRPLVVYCAHGFNGASAHDRLPRLTSRAAERAFARITDLLFVMNDEDEVWARVSPYGDVVRIPSIGLDLDHYQPCELDDLTHHRIVVVAELITRKRVHLAIETLALLDERFTLTILGDGPLRGALHDLVRRRNLEARVRFEGHVDDVRPYVRSAWLVLSTARQEGLARSLLEAMALGTPAAGFAARGVTDVLRDGCGLLVEGASPTSLAEALTGLADDPSSRESMRAKARELVLGHDAREIARVVVDTIESAYDLSRSASGRF